MISIIVPVYNVEKYLDDCIKSILRQTFKNLEIILVDDGSTDKSGEICDAWAAKDNRIKVIHKKNGGTSDSRNHGTAVASGEYIYFLDSDDFMSANWLEILYTKAKETDADIVKGGIHYVLDSPDLNISCENIEVYKSIAFKNEESLLPYHFLVRLIDHEGYNCVTNQLTKAYLYKRCPFPSGRSNEDHSIYFELLKYVKKIVLIPQCGLYYRQRATSIAHVKSDNLIANMVEDYVEHSKILVNDYSDTKNAKAALVRATELFFFYLASAQRMESIKSDLTKQTWQKLYTVTKNYNMKQLLPKVLFFQYKIYSISDSLYYQIMRIKKAVLK